MKILANVMEQVIKRNPNEPEFHQAVQEVLESLEPVAEKHPEWVKAGIFDRIVEPERQIIFQFFVHYVHIPYFTATNTDISSRYISVFTYMSCQFEHKALAESHNFFI